MASMESKEEREWKERKKDKKISVKLEPTTIEEENAERNLMMRRNHDSNHQS